MEASTQRAVTPYSLLPPAPATTNLLFVFIYLLFKNIYTFAAFLWVFFAEFLLMGVCFDVQNKAETKNNKAWLEGESALSWLTLRPLLGGGPRIHLVTTAKRVERRLCWCSACMFPAPWVSRLPWQPGSVLCPAYPYAVSSPDPIFSDCLTMLGAPHGQRDQVGSGLQNLSTVHMAPTHPCGPWEFSSKWMHVCKKPLARTLQWKDYMGL